MMSKEVKIEDIWNKLSDEKQKQIREIQAYRDKRVAFLKTMQLEEALVKKDAIEKEIAGLLSMWIPVIDRNDCSDCEDCIPYCPRNAIIVNYKGEVDINYSLCYPWNIGNCNPAPCIANCPEDAIYKAYI